MNRFGIPEDPQSFDELKAAFRALYRLVQGIANSPDVVMGENSMRLSTHNLVAAGDSFALPIAGTDHFKVTASYNEDDENYDCTIRGGYFLIRALISGEDSLIRVIPKIDIDSTMTPLPPDDTASIVLEAGEAIFLKVETDDMDGLKEDGEDPAGFLVTIVSAAEAEESTQSQPIDDQNLSGTDGVYYYPIALLEIDDDDNATVKQVQQGGPIMHTPPLWKGENVGAGAEIFKGRDTANNTYQIRTIPDHYGIYSKKIGDEVHVKQRNSNVGAGAPIWKPPVDGMGDAITDQDLLPSEDSKFRSLKIASTLNGIFEWQEVDDEDEEVFLKSNGVDATYSDGEGGSIAFIAGVASNLTSPDISAYKDLNLEQYIQEWVATSADGVDVVDFINVPSSPSVIHYWRNGHYVGDSDPDGEDPPPAGLKTLKMTYLQESS
jgi:hypothetical protein